MRCIAYPVVILALLGIGNYCCCLRMRQISTS